MDPGAFRGSQLTQDPLRTNLRRAATSAKRLSGVTAALTHAGWAHSRPAAETRPRLPGRCPPRDAGPHNRASRFQHLAQLPAHAGAKLNVSMNEDRLVRWLRRAELQKNKKIILNRLYLFLFLSSFRFTGNLTGNERDPIHPLPPPRRGGARYRRRRRASIPGARRPCQGSDKRVPTGVRHPGLTQSSVPAPSLLRPARAPLRAPRLVPAERFAPCSVSCRCAAYAASLAQSYRFLRVFRGFKAPSFVAE